MPDVFDQLDGAPVGDVFDQVQDGDLFDQVASKEIPFGAEQAAQLRRESELAAGGRQMGAGNDQLLTAIADSLLPDPPTPQQLHEKELADKAGVEPIPVGTRILSGMHSGVQKAAMWPRIINALGLSAADLLGMGDTQYAEDQRAMLRGYSDKEADISRRDRQMFGDDDVIQQLAEGTGRAVAELPLQLGPGAVAKTPGAALKVAAAAGGAMGGGTQLATDLGEGRPTAEALPYAIASGLATAVTTRAFGATGAEAVFRAEGVQGVRNRLLTVLKDAGMEGAEEAVDQIQQDFLERYNRNPEKPFDATLKDVLMAGAVGFIVGGGVGGAKETAAATSDALADRREGRAFDQASTELANQRALDASLPVREQNPANREQTGGPNPASQGVTSPAMSSFVTSNEAEKTDMPAAIENLTAAVEDLQATLRGESPESGRLKRETVTSGNAPAPKTDVDQELLQRAMADLPADARAEIERRLEQERTEGAEQPPTTNLPGIDSKLTVEPAVGEQPAPKHSFKVGDRVIYQGEESTITRAVPSSDYVAIGKRAVPAKDVQLAKPLTKPAEDATTVSGAAAGTITGHNEQSGSEVTAATTLAAEPMPAEVNKAAPVTETTAETLKPRPTSKKRFRLNPRSDGVPDILDSIQELGGIRPPGEHAGGEYDGYREAMVGPARVLISRKAAHAADTIIAELQGIGAPGANRIKSVDDLWNTIAGAVKGREKLRTQDRGQRGEAKQQEEFQRRVVQGLRAKKESNKFVAIPAKALLEGDTFEAQGHKFTVQDLEFDDAGGLVSVTVKDGPKFGVQQVDGDELLHVDKGSVQLGPEHDSGTPEALTGAIREVSSIYGVPPEETAQVLEKGKPYQTEFDLSAAQPESGSSGQPGPADSLTTFAAEDFKRDFAAGSKVSSIDQAQTAAAVPTYNVNGTIIRSSADFAKTLLAIRSPNNESLKVVILEKLTGKVVHSEVMYAGTLDTLSVDTRDFIRLFEKHGKQGTDMLISHNHPSGNPTPSDADRKYTGKLQLAARAAGFEVIDHVITNGDRYYSLDLDRMETLQTPHTAPWERVARHRLKPVTDAQSFEALVKSLRSSSQHHAHVIYLTTRHTVSAIERVMPTLAAAQEAVIRGIGTESAAALFIDYGPQVSRTEAYNWTREIQRSLVGSTTRILDFAANGVMSGVSEGLMSPTGNFLGETGGDQLREDSDEYATNVKAAETELLAAIRQHIEPPAGMTKAQALRAKNEAAAKLRRVVAAQLEQMSSTNVDAQRTPEQTADMISQTVDLLNGIQDEITERQARGQEATSDLTKLRQDLQTRLNILKGWADDATDAAAAGAPKQKPAPADPESRIRQMTFEAATNPDRKSIGEFWDALKRGLRYLTSPIPELPLTGDVARKSALFRRGFRLFTAETTRVQQDAAAKVKQVLEPLEVLRTREQNDALKSYFEAGGRLDRARQAGDDTKVKEFTQRLAELEKRVNADPFNLFRKIVLYRDLWWRGSFLKNDQGKAITLPNGLTQDEVAAELRSLYAQLDQHGDKAAINEALKRHYALTDELQKSILAHGEIIPESLRNPMYFPHHILENWTGRIDRVRPSTEEDFRRYLIAPQGSAKLLQADYLQAMYVHTADVLAHNARVDLVRKYWQPYDISERLKKEHGDDWDKPWNMPAGYRLFNPFKKLPLRMDYILSREVLADKLGVLFNDGDLRARMGEAGKVLKVKPEDLHAAMVAGEKIKWALPAEVADALDGITKREGARANPGLGHALGTPARAVNNFWKKTKLFAPWNWIRYEYGNLTTDVIDKVLVADPKVATYLKQAASEILTASHYGTKSEAFKAASREGVFDTITASEAGELQRLREFTEFQTTGESRRNTVHNFLAATTKASHFRESTFRYAKFLADVDRLKRGEPPVYAGAYHEDIEALGDTAEGQQQMLQGDELNYAKAAEISLKTFGDYNSLSVMSQWLRTYAVPFFSWQDVNFRYHANQLRNIADGLKGIKGGTPRQVALKYAAVRVASTLAGVAIAQQLWNTVGGVMAGLWDKDDDLESQLSEADRRRSHVILGKDKNGQVLVAYTPSAFADVAEWIGGLNAKRLFVEYMKGDITLEQFIKDYAKQLPADVLNKLAQSAGPLGKAPYELTSGQATFPDVLDQRSIPKRDRWWRLVGTMTDDRAVNWLRQVFDKDYYSQPAAEQLQQIILQVRRRDPEQWAYYEAREAAADWKEAKTGKRFEGGSYDAPEAQVLRNFRRAIYRADVANAERFYRRLLDYGYTAERLNASIEAQAPLSDLSKEQRKEYLQTLDARASRELELAESYYSRIGALDKRERKLFPTNYRVKHGSPFEPNDALLREIMQR